MLVPVASTEITADGAAKASPGAVVAVVLTAGTGAAASLILYDNASAASGTKLLTLRAPQGESVPFTPAAPIKAANGIYADIGGSGAAAYVAYI